MVAQREGTPFPALLEAFMMELMFEVIREAGVRMPRVIGPAVSIIGALVIGQAAVQADWSQVQSLSLLPSQLYLTL